MSYVLLCEGRVAEQPYLITDLRKKIYTIEELCFYIYQNASLCGEELVKPQLINWIGTQCGYSDLQESIRTILNRDPKPEKIASQIFAYANYLTKQERDAVCERIRKYSLLSVVERKKMRADTNVVSGNYRDAIRDYEDILDKEEYRTEKEKHHIIYNIGCCYGSLFYYNLAYEWFLKAAEMKIDTESDLTSALFCKYMELSEVDFSEFVNQQKQFQDIKTVFDAKLRDYNREYQTKASDAKSKDALTMTAQKLKTEV